jgi:hypothetical protein
VYDRELEAFVKDFQQRHKLDDDGVIGRMTWVQLSTYDGSLPPPMLSAQAASPTTTK